MKNNLIYTFILARSGSKSIKNKNIYKINNKPLISYTINLSNKIKLISKTFVFTDSSKYAEISKKYGCIIPFLRSKKISKDNTTDFETIYYCLNKLLQLDFKKPDLIVFLRPTTPIRNPKLINSAIAKFYKLRHKYDSLRSIHEMPETAYKAFKIKNNILAPAFNEIKDVETLNKPRQFFEKTYQANGYIDILKPNVILNQKKLYGNKIYGFLTEQCIDIDDKFSLQMAEQYLANE